MSDGLSATIWTRSASAWRRCHGGTPPTADVALNGPTGTVRTKRNECDGRPGRPPPSQIAVEATTNTWAVAEILRPFVAAVVVGNPLPIKAIAQAKVKTDKIDAEVLAQLLRCDYLPAVWHPDEQTQKLRRLATVRAGLVGD